MRREAELLWRREKYAVMYYSQAHYNRIRLLMRENAAVADIQAAIAEAYSIQPTAGSQRNAIQHMWGYFKKYATAEEKQRYEQYIAEDDFLALRHYLAQLAVQYDVAYLQESTILQNIEENVMKTILVTGFEPFLQLPVNPTEQIARALDGRQFGDYIVHGKVLPVDFHESEKVLKEYLTALAPDIVVSLGVAAGRHQVTPERIAINVKDGEADNKGYAPTDEAIDADAADGLFTMLPIRAFVTALQEAGYPAKISNSAGTYLCNNIMYAGLQYAQQYQKQAGFIHVPANFDISIRHPRIPGWHQRDIQAAIEICLTTLTKA